MASEMQTTGGTTIVRQPAPIDGLRDLLAKARPSMEMVLPKHVNAERLIKVALVAVSKTPKLLECTKTSIVQSVMKAAELGLDCGGALGSAYLVPYKKNSKDARGNWQSEMVCQLIVGYRGLIDLARRSGALSSIEARVVRERDRFELAFGLEPKLIHEPFLDGEAGGVRLVYCVARLTDGGTHVEVMTRDQVERIRERSKASKDGPWVTDWEEMARKTVVRRTCKYLPLSAEIVRAMQEDRDAPDFFPPSVALEMPTEAEPQRGPAGLLARISAPTPESEEEIPTAPEMTDSEEMESFPAPEPEPQSEPKKGKR